MDNTIIIIITVLIITGLFFALRELTCWYFKFSKMIEQNDEIIKLLKDLNIAKY